MSERHTESHLAAEAQQNLAQVVTAAGDDWRLIVVDAFEVVVVIVIVSVSVDVVLTILDSGQQSRLGRTLLSFGGIIIPKKIFSLTFIVLDLIVELHEIVVFAVVDFF